VTASGERILRGPGGVRGFGVGWDTNWDVRLIELNELFSGGVPRDGIPALDAPRFVTVSEANGFLANAEPVIQVEVNGDIRAYPLQIMTWHEIVNDVVGGVPVAVTFCPLCNTAIAYHRRIDDLTLEFGVSGLLRNSDLVMYDRLTESLWQQIGGAAIVGDMVGAKLRPIPAQIVSWQQFHESFPDGLVLSQNTGFQRRYGSNPYGGYDSAERPLLFAGDLDPRLGPADRVVTLNFDAEPVAYPFAFLAEHAPVNDARAGLDLVVFWTPGTVSALDHSIITESKDIGATGVFRREANGQLLTFIANAADTDQQTFRDEQTGTVWNIFGEALEGPLAGTQLEEIIHANHFWFAWAAFEPDTVVVGRE
jgi:hypothetical protein